jgi:hypothetical protein
MSHATDAELLDLALLAEDADAGVSRHVSACADCSRRLDQVQAEQGLLRRAFTEEPRPAAAPVRPLRWVAAAWLFVALGVGATASLLMTSHRPTSTSSSHRLRVRQMERDLDSLQRKISTTREALSEPSSEPAARDYVRLLLEGEDRFVELMSSYCDPSVPLAEEQKTALKSLLDHFLGRAQVDERRKLEEEFLARLSSVLTPGQYEIVREYLRQEADKVWTRGIDELLADMAVALDLRFSEVEPLRSVLAQGFPRSALAAIPGGDPGEVLVDEPALSGRIRGALRPGYHRAFDLYLAQETREREGVRRVMQTFRSK